MSISTFEANAQLAVYAHNLPEVLNQPVYQLLGAVASGEVAPT